MWILLSIIIFQPVYSYNISDSLLYNSDPCLSLCNTDEEGITSDQPDRRCWEGCTWMKTTIGTRKVSTTFHLQYFFNWTQVQCNRKCAENLLRRNSCYKGCTLMRNEIKFRIDELLELLISEGTLYDNYNYRYTMPIQLDVDPDNDVVTKPKYSRNDWLNCASENSGVPRWILLAFILIAVLLALMLSFQAEKNRNNEHNVDLAKVEVPDDKLLLAVDEQSKDPFFKVTEVEFPAPPKYDEVTASEKV